LRPQRRGKKDFPLRQDLRGVVHCPRSACLTIQLPILSAHVPPYWWFGFHFFLPPPTTTPLTGGSGPTDHRGWAGAWCEWLFGFPSVAVESKGGSALYKGMCRRDRLPFRNCLLQTLQRPFIFTRAFAICLLRPALSSLPASLQFSAQTLTTGLCLVPDGWQWMG
jgi:hypothetical protein